MLRHAAVGLLLFGTHCIVGAWAGDQFHGFKPPHRESEKWVSHGRDLTNTRWAKFEKELSPLTVGQLKEKWTFTTAGDASATPTIADGVVYFPDWAGYLYAVKQDTGDLIWKKTLTEIANTTLGTGNFTIVSRTSLTIAGDRLIFGLQGPAAVLAVNRTTGDLLWASVLDTFFYAIITMSGSEYEGYYYVGTSSGEEVADVVCCTFQGAFFKLDIKDGKKIWRVPMMPDNGGRTDQYAGNALWGSSPPIDTKRRDVYIATGNNYRVPEEVEECEKDYRNQTNPPIPDPCLDPDNHAEAVLAINIDTGKISWSRHLGGFDTWILVCTYPLPSFNLSNCPGIPGEDYDFGMAPMLLSIPGNSSDNHSKHRGRDILVVGQKSGFIWALDRGSGDIVWDTPAGPGGSVGGSSWGMTTDGERVFTNIINSLKMNFTLLPSATITRKSGWVSLNASTGEILWSTESPSEGWNVAPLTHANGIIFAGSSSPPTAIVALDAKTGAILKSIPTNGSVFGGASIMKGCAYNPVGVTVGARSYGRRLNVTIPPGNSVVVHCVQSALW